MGNIIKVDFARNKNKSVFEGLQETEDKIYEKLCMKDIAPWGCGCPECTRGSRRMLVIGTGITIGLIALAVYIIFFAF